MDGFRRVCRKTRKTNRKQNYNGESAGEPPILITMNEQNIISPTFVLGGNEEETPKISVRAHQSRVVMHTCHTHVTPQPPRTHRMHHLHPPHSPHTSRIISSSSLSVRIIPRALNTLPSSPLSIVPLPAHAHVLVCAREPAATPLMRAKRA
jgi:hypothetical protein